jgi:hypothetical protein
MIGATETGQLVRYDPRSLEPLGRPLDVTSGDVSELVFDGSGDLLAVRRPNGTVTIVDVQTGTQLGQPVPGQVVQSAAGTSRSGATASCSRSHGRRCVHVGAVA